MKKQIKRKIYLLSKRDLKPIEVIQFETGVQLIFEVQDLELDTTATATLFVRKPSGEFVFQEDNISLTGNTVVIDLHNQAITEYGKPFFQIKFKKDEEVISTYSGMITVEKSLDDAGAEESKTVVAAFDTFTDAEIARIEEATQAQIELMKAEVEAKGESVLATIPEDYTATYNRVNNLFNAVANAIKGTVSGSVVRVDDVSPVEHRPVVKVHGKNIFDTSKIAVQSSTDNIYISAVGEGYIDITTKEAYDGNGHCVTWVKLKELCPQMKAGKRYALSATTTAWNKMIYLKEIDLFWSYGTRQIVTEEMLECTVGFYGFNVIREQGTGTCRISNIQCEEGYDITEYTPYINPSTVTVTADGINYTPETDGTVSGILSTALSGGISTDNEGITIECEYNKDTSNVIEKLTNAVAALGGAV